TPLPDGTEAPAFLYKKEARPADASADSKAMELDGGVLYANNCQACHQAHGEGLTGAFPPLKGSPVVLDDNPELRIEIILKGYDARQEYGAMPPIGTTNGLNAAEIAAIINHERSSWGNNARKIPPEEVADIVNFLQTEKVSQ